MNLWFAVEGVPHPLGATWIESERAYNFAIYSKHGTGVVLLLYSDQDAVNPVVSQDQPHHTYDTVIYELHVKGFTKSPTSGVPDHARGS
jgi:pullulanase/glycogen debranching enzyme